MNSEYLDLPQQALSALLAMVTADYALSETLALFVGDPEERPAGEARCGMAMLQAVDWCMYALREEGTLARADEALAEVAAAAIVRRARCLSIAESPRAAEAFYLCALALIVDDFCVLWQATGRRYSDTPLPGLHETLATCLALDYRLDIAAPSSDWAAVLSAADDLRRTWRRWASVPPPACC